MLRVGFRGRQRRRGYAIRGYVGHNGSGKSLLAVYDLMPSLDAGRRCLSTVRLLDWNNPRPCDDPDCASPQHPDHLAAHPGWIPWTSWNQLEGLTHTDIFADEITGVASSRDYSSLPAQVADMLMQLRRADLTFTWTAPAWTRADLLIREVSQSVTFCRGYFPQVIDGERAWRSRRLVYGITYDLLAEVSWDQDERHRSDAVAKEALWKPYEVYRAYDSLAPVLSIGTRQRGGSCPDCGGRVPVERCQCSG